MVQSILYVNPTSGNDLALGNLHAPFKTLSNALNHALEGTTIQLAPGTYEKANGEIFPLIIPGNVIVLGDESNKGQNIIILGSGDYNSLTFKQQKVTLLLEGNSQIRGVTITNPQEKGTGIWIESALPLIINNSLKSCGREGIFVTGKSKPIIRDNLFENNASSGIFLVHNAKGELRRNLYQTTGYGIVISKNAAPLLSDNQLINNQIGIYLSRNARPVLRRNLIQNNSKSGLVITGEAQPDFGSSQDPAGNILQDNGSFDLLNETALTLVSVGNQLNPARIEGMVEFLASVINQSNLGPAQFSDISGYWAENFIEGLVKQDLIRGFPDGSFRPEANLTRAEYAALIATSFDLPRSIGAKVKGFMDVAETFWGVEAIQKVTAMGFISGFPDGTFRPQRNLTRVEAFVSLVNGLGLTGGNPNLLLSYSDRGQIPSYATNALSIATQRRLVVNYPQTNILAPLKAITRAEIAAVIYQALVATSQAEAISSPYIVNPDPYILSFTDIKEHWAAEFIRTLASLDLVSGFADGSFAPDALLNRAQYAALVVKIFNPPPIRPAHQFLDISADFWALSAIQQAYRSGFISGFPDGTFHPRQTLRRVHLIASLTNGLALPISEEQNLDFYQDQDLIPKYASAAVSAATKAGIVVNYPQRTQLQPKQEVTRAEAIAMIYQGLVYKGQAMTIDSPYIVRR